MGILDVHFLPLSKSNIQSNGLCVIAAICEKTGCLICPLVKNEPKVDPQQPQIGGIQSFLPSGTSNDAWYYAVKRNETSQIFIIYENIP